MGERIKAYRAIVDIYDLNGDYSDSDILRAVEDGDAEFVTVRKIVRKDVFDWSDEHVLNHTGESAVKAADEHFKDGMVIYDGM